MSSLRLEEVPFEFNGKTYLLRCNMAVLEDVQEQQDGDFSALLELPTYQSTVLFLAAMMNDYADEMGWPERFTPATLRRRVSLAMIRQLDVLGIITRGISPLVQEAAQPAAAPEPGESGN